MAGAPASEVGATAETTACEDGIVVEALAWIVDASIELETGGARGGVFLDLLEPLLG